MVERVVYQDIAKCSCIFNFTLLEHYLHTVVSSHFDSNITTKSNVNPPSLFLNILYSVIPALFNRSVRSAMDNKCK